MRISRLVMAPLVIAFGLLLAVSLVATPRESGTDPPPQALYESCNDEIHEVMVVDFGANGIAGGEAYSVEYVGFVPLVVAPAYAGSCDGSEDGAEKATLRDWFAWGWRPFQTTTRVTTATDG